MLPEGIHYIDISPEISERTAVFPGDAPFKRKIALDFKSGDYLLLSEISGSLHLGAHADAPSHYHPGGKGISERDLLPYLGPAQVIEVSLPKNQRILPHHIAQYPIRAKRVLFKTRSFSDHQCWSDDFNSLSPELIQYLTNQGVRLVGIDTPSVDPADSKALETHQAVFENDLSILEGLDLERTPPGLYTLIALPLKIREADASWVRAVLIPTSSEGVQK